MLRLRSGLDRVQAPEWMDGMHRRAEHASQVKVMRMDARLRLGLAKRTNAAPAAVGECDRERWRKAADEIKRWL